jgi:hypothetical protein
MVRIGYRKLTAAGDRRMRALAVLGAGVIAAMAVAVAAASHHGSPVRVGGVERTDTWAVLFLASFALAFVSYDGALLVLRGGRQGREKEREVEKGRRGEAPLLH